MSTIRRLILCLDGTCNNRDSSTNVRAAYDWLVQNYQEQVDPSVLGYWEKKKNPPPNLVKPAPART